MSELQSADMVEKLKDNFDEMVVYKDLKKSNFITSFKMPSFMRDWVDWKSIKNRIVNYQEQMKFLAKISVDIDIKTQGLSFSLPDFGLTTKDTVIPRDVWENCSAALLKAEENLGISSRRATGMPEKLSW